MSPMPCDIFSDRKHAGSESLVRAQYPLLLTGTSARLPGTLARRGRCRAAYQQQGVPDMPHLKLFRLVGAVVVLTAMPLLAASAQTPAPPPSPGASPPPATKPDAGPNGPTSPMTKPSNPAESPATAPRRTDKSTSAPG